MIRCPIAGFDHDEGRPEGTPFVLVRAGAVVRRSYMSFVWLKRMSVELSKYGDAIQVGW